MRNIIVLGALALTMSGCASTVAQSPAPEARLAPVVPSYSERVDSQTLEQVRATACPADSKWEVLPWQKIIPLANACVKAKELIKVEKMGDLLARRAHLTPWGPYYLALGAESRRDYPRAVWMLELALKKAPKEGLFHYELGRIQWELGVESDAIKHLKLASEYNPSLTGAHWVLGQLSLQRQDYAEADRYLQKALASDASHGPSLLAMAQLKLQTKDYERAETFLNRAIAVNPRSAKARLALAQVQEQHLKKMDEALRTYKQLKQLVSERKLDDPVTLNLDEKIQALQKNLAQANDAGKESQRQPSAAAAKGPVKQ